MDDLDDMFVYQLREMYAVEEKLVEVLGDLAEDASNERLAAGFRDHRDETREHVERLGEAFRALDEDLGGTESLVLDAMIEERERFVDQAPRGELHDLYDLQAGVKTERMEISSYESLLTLAEKLELDDDVTDPLEANLDSEEVALNELETMAEGSKAKGLLGKLLG